jgi:hypothetical protein
MKPTIFAPSARAEFEAAAEWYECKAQVVRPTIGLVALARQRGTLKAAAQSTGRFVMQDCSGRQR